MRPTPFLAAPALALLLAPAPGALAASPQDAQGLWLSGDKAAVIQFAPCDAGGTAALCGRIVWDKDAGTPQDACGVQIAQLRQWDGSAWRNGWVHDPRTGKNYKGALRVKGDTLALRAYIGTEMLGETEEMARVATLPEGCKPR